MKVKFVFLRAMEMESILINNYAFLICFYTTTGMSEGGGGQPDFGRSEGAAGQRLRAALLLAPPDF